jgi:copper resistance protein C
VIRHLVVLALAAVGLVLGTGTALAHDVLVGSNPANGARLDTGPSTVTLSYNLPVQNLSSTLTVIGPDGLHYESGRSVVNGNTLSAPVGPLGPAGTYTVGYRIISDDGHPVSGETTFTLTKPGTGHGLPAAQSPAAAQQPDTQGTPDQHSTDNAAPLWPWIVGAVLLIAAGATIALRLGRHGE